MAEIVWAEPALNDLDAIADYIALDDPEAARRLVQRIFKHVGLLQKHPRLGSKPQELKRLALPAECRTAVSRLLSRRFWANLDPSRDALATSPQPQTA